MAEHLKESGPTEGLEPQEDKHTAAPDAAARDTVENTDPKDGAAAAAADGAEHKRLFEDFSFAQVLASSLSAVTSVLLSQQIGLIGGLLGVAAGAAVATIATQAYRSVLDVSAERLRKQIIINPSPASPEAAKAQPSVEASASPKAAAEPANTPFLRSKAGIALLIAAVSLAAVAIVALTVDTATKGQGLGERVVIIQQAPAEDAADDAATDEAGEQAAEQQADGQASPQASQEETPSSEADAAEAAAESTAEDQASGAEAADSGGTDEQAAPQESASPAQDAASGQEGQIQPETAESGSAPAQETPAP